MHDIPFLIHFFAEAGPTPYTPVNVCNTTDDLVSCKNANKTQ